MTEPAVTEVESHDVPGVGQDVNVSKWGHGLGYGDEDKDDGKYEDDEDEDDSVLLPT